MFRCSHEAKYIAYRALVRPILEYAAVVWCPHATGDIKSLESLQGWAARWIVVAVGVQQFHHGLSQHVIVVPSFVFQPFSPDVTIYQCASSTTFIVNEYLSHFLNTVHSTQLHPQGVIVFHYSHPSLPSILEDIHFL